MLDAMNGGWIFELGAYRDLVMHSAPISIASNHLFCIRQHVIMPKNRHIPIIRFPIPGNPDELYKKRGKRDNFDQYIEQFEFLAKKAIEEDGKYDCLEYSKGIVEKLSSLALNISKTSPIKPQVRQFVDGINCSITTVER